MLLVWRVYQHIFVDLPPSSPSRKFEGFIKDVTYGLSPLANNVSYRQCNHPLIWYKSLTVKSHANTHILKGPRILKKSSRVSVFPTNITIVLFFFLLTIVSHFNFCFLFFFAAENFQNKTIFLCFYVVCIFMFCVWSIA